MGKTIILVIILTCLPCHVVSSGNDSYLSPYQLPRLLVAFSYYISNYSDFEKQFELNNQEPLCLKKLRAELEQFNKQQLGTRLAFIEHAFIVQNEIPDHVSGYVPCYDIKNKTARDVTYDHLLFITTPIASIENKALMIVSTSRPARTTIISVDSSLTMTLIYDSFDQEAEFLISAIDAVRVIEPGIILLVERPNQNNPLREKLYLLDLSSGDKKLMQLGKDDTCCLPAGGEQKGQSK